MAPTLSPLPSLLFLFLFLFLFSALAVEAALATVPASRTFRYVNEGEFGDYITEYDATYRPMPIGTSPFQLMWYNATPNAYFVALRMGTSRSESLRRWVWEANRGRPVGENATLTFGGDGNLVIAEADGTVAWSTGTADKGVVGLRVLPNGNIVLHDKKGRFVWQSFDHPTDTLLVGQSLRLAGGPAKLVSRKSDTENSDGKYSLVLERRGLAMYMDASSPQLRLPYFNYLGAPFGRFTFSPATPNLTFTAVYDGAVWDLQLEHGNGASIMARPKYNATLSFLRLAVDGNLVIYTYYDPADSEAWDRNFAFFSDSARGVLAGCELPSKCGSLGVCKDEMCVACPTPKGILGWSESCSPPKLPGPCKGAAGATGAGYYKVVGVENFLTKFTKGEGAVKVEECRRRCSSDCKCLGFFFWEESSSCWLAPALGTLNLVSNSSHVAYIKSY